MGIRTTNLERQFAIDELIGNITEDGIEKTARIPIQSLTNQLAGSGPFILGNTIYALTKTALDAITPSSPNMGGVVLQGVAAGYYARVGSAWVKGRGFPDTFAKVAVSGSGTAQAGLIGDGVDPASIEVFFAKVVTPNTGPLTLSISGGPSRSVRNLAGNALAAGEWTGMVMFYLNEANQYQLLIDAGAAASAAASATSAGIDADRAEAAAALSGPTGAYAGTLSPAPNGVQVIWALPVEPASVAHIWVSLSGILQDPGTYSLDGTDLIFSTAPPTGSTGSYRIVALASGEVVPPDLSVTTSKIGLAAVTRAKLAPDAVGPDELDEDAVNANHIDATAAAAIRTKLGIPTPVAFSAHKNGAAQTGVVSATATKVTFGTEDFDVGGYYNVATSRFTPPSGKYMLFANVRFSTGVVDQAEFGLLFYKNGSVYKQRYNRMAAASADSVIFFCLVDADGDDYFEVYAYGGGAGDKIIDGAASGTTFSGHSV